MSSTTSEDPMIGAEPDADGHDDDGTIVLPWWQNPVNIVTMLVATLLAAGMLGWIIGDAANDVESNDADVGFLQDMRVHHEQAIDIGFIFLRLSDTDPALRTVARSIIFDQGIEIGMMLQLLTDLEAPGVSDDGTAMDWMGHSVPIAEMAGMATEDDLNRLASQSGAGADELFVELMTAHHEGGIEMAEEAADRAANDDVRRYATAWASGQRSEIVEMTGLVDRVRS